MKMSYIKSSIAIVFIEIFMTTQFGVYFIDIAYSAERLSRRTRNISVTFDIATVLQQAELEINSAITAESAIEKTEHIYRASQYYNQAFQVQPCNDALVDTLKGWLTGADTIAERQLLAGLVLVNLTDHQGVSEEERLSCLDKVKQFQYWVHMPQTYQDRVDMHVHTFRSDGAATPAGIVLQAWQEGMSTLGVVDHNTFAHIYEAVRAGEILGINVTPGVEFDVVDEARNIKNMHVVAYFDKGNSADYKAWIDGLEGSAMGQQLENLRAAYVQKIGKMVENFNKRSFIAEDGSGDVFELSYDDLKGYLSDTPNKYQFGMALLAKYGKDKLGVNSYREATAKYFSDLAEWNWQQESLDSVGNDATYIKITPDGMALDEIMKFAVAQGGTVILPHPGEFLAADDSTVTKTTRVEKLEIFKDLLRDYALVDINGREYLGIRGIELFSTKNTPEDMEDVAAIIEDFNSTNPIYSRYQLIATAGSDTHSMPGQGVGLCIGSGNIPWVATTYIFNDKLNYQMGLVESAANADAILSSLGLEVPVFDTAYELGEYAYWAKSILTHDAEINKDVLQKGLPLLLKSDAKFRHLNTESKAAVISGLAGLVEKTGKSVDELMSQAVSLAQADDEGAGTVAYSYFITPGSRLQLAESLGVSKTKLLGDWFRDFVNRNGDKIFLAGNTAGTVALMAMFGNLLNYTALTEMGAQGVGLFAALELVAAPFFFKVSELVNKWVAGKLSPEMILPEEDLATYGYESTIIPEDARSVFVFNLGGLSGNREAYVRDTIESNPGIPVMLFSYERNPSKLQALEDKVNDLNEEYGAGYPGGKAIFIVSKANSWWEGPAPGPKHGSLEDLGEWLADMDRGYEATNPEYADELAAINAAGGAFNDLSDGDAARFSAPTTEFFSENFASTGEPAALAQMREIALSGEDSKEQLKNLVRMLADKITPGSSPNDGQFPLWYTAPIDNTTHRPKEFKTEQEAIEYKEKIEASLKESFGENWADNRRVEITHNKLEGTWRVTNREVFFNPEYIKRDFKWVVDENGKGSVIAETWAVWEDPTSGEKTYIRDRRVIFDNITADLETFRNLLSIIPLDGDNSVPLDPETGLGAGMRLIGKSMATVNQPVVNEKTMRIEEGYGLIQPLQIIGNVGSTAWTETMARERIRAMYDQRGQMNFLGTGVDYGKNMKFIRDAQGRGVLGWVLKATGNGTRGGRRNSIKPSPDIGEGAFLRPAFALDLVFSENEQPTNYVVDYLRSGKWGTGDVVNGIQDGSPWMVNSQGVWGPNPYSGVDKLRIFSNAVGVGTNIAYPFWMALWGVSAFLGVVAQNGVIDPTLGAAMFAATAGTYILLSKVLPEGKNFAFGDFVRTQALMNNVIKLPPIILKGLGRFITGREMTFASTRKYEADFEGIGLKELYFWNDGKPGVLFAPALTGLAITGTALLMGNTPWLTWGSVLSGSLLVGGLITYFTGRDKGHYADLAANVEQGSDASGYRMLGDEWDRVATENMTSKASRLKDVLETYATFKEMIDSDSINLSAVQETAHLVKNPTLYANVMKDFIFAACESGEPRIEYLRKAIWDNLTNDEKSAFISVAGNEEAAEGLFFNYIGAVYDEVYKEEISAASSVIDTLGFEFKEAMPAKVDELRGLLEQTGLVSAESEAQRRIYDLVGTTISNNPDITAMQMLDVIDKSIASFMMWLDFEKWISENQTATPLARLEKFNELMGVYSLLLSEDSQLYDLVVDIAKEEE
jgi:hypothetical protein